MDHTLFVVQLNGSKIELYSDRNPFYFDWPDKKTSFFHCSFFPGKKHRGKVLSRRLSSSAASVGSSMSSNGGAQKEQRKQKNLEAKRKQLENACSYSGILKAISYMVRWIGLSRSKCRGLQSEEDKLKYALQSVLGRTISKQRRYGVWSHANAWRVKKI